MNRVYCGVRFCLIPVFLVSLTVFGRNIDLVKSRNTLNVERWDEFNCGRLIIALVTSNETID